MDPALPALEDHAFVAGVSMFVFVWCCWYIVSILNTTLAQTRIGRSTALHIRINTYILSLNRS